MSLRPEFTYARNVDTDGGSIEFRILLSEIM